jgi:hypothetical protein|tara:strand:- start:281 stop:814 length:534 start_codon:yes stop_codon:yes gene_type:complete
MSQIKVNSIVPVGGLPSGANGGIIQTIQTVKTDTFSTTSLSFVDITGLSATITPSSNSNKVLVKVHLGFVSSHNTSAYPNFVLVRGSTQIGKGTSGTGDRTNCSFAVLTNLHGGYSGTAASFEFLDSPATTSATTYKLQMLSGFSSRQIYINRMYNDDNYEYTTRSASTLTLMEVST